MKCYEKRRKYYLLSLSYGKDSIAAIEACNQLGWPIDYCIHAQLMATPTIPADLPPMIEFKSKANQIIKEKYGLDVITVSAQGTKFGKDKGQIRSFEGFFYGVPDTKKENKTIRGWPYRTGPWCNNILKLAPLAQENMKRYLKELGVEVNDKTKIIRYLGIAADEEKRIAKHSGKPGIYMPLVELNWDEEQCKNFCEENDLLCSLYESQTRTGCWFCINQSVESLRSLRHDYPEYWKLMLQWEEDSPNNFTTDHSILEYEKRFQMEDQGLIDPNKRFLWKTVTGKDARKRS